MPTHQPEHCPVCDSTLKSPSSRLDHVYFKCPQCGTFGLTTSAEHLLPELLAGLGRNRAVLSYAISRKPRVGINTILFTLADCEAIIKAGYLPTPKEQADNLVRWLGNNLGVPGEIISGAFQRHGTTIGFQSEAEYSFVVRSLMGEGLLENRPDGLSLSYKGWEHYEQLRRAIPSGRRAFMAMAYGNVILDSIVNEHFRPAVSATGFLLKRLDDEPRAGLIDDRLRVEIESARFVIVDVTHSNLGAYWEAGYAEGLGKPVIYTCEESKFHESHFDTNHRLHVKWTESDPTSAATRLKATIRATIPEATPEE